MSLGDDPQQLILPLVPPDSARFVSYWPGSNGEVVAQVLELATQRDGARAIWIFGGGAVGKSHLLQAAAAQRGESGDRVVYLPLGSFPIDGEAVLAGLHDAALICLDDLQAVAGEPRWEQALFALWNELQELGGRLLLASRDPPAALRWTLADLQSRFGAAAVYRLAPLDDAQMLAALQGRARLRGFDLPDEVGQWLLRHVPRDAGTLFALLDRLDTATLATHRSLTVPFVRAVVDALPFNTR